MPENALLGLVLWLWVTAATLSAGDFLLGLLRLAWSNNIQRFVFAGAFGLGLWCLSLFWVGWLIAYTPISVCVITIIFSVLSMYGLSGIIFRAPAVRALEASEKSLRRSRSPLRTLLAIAARGPSAIIAAASPRRNRSKGTRSLSTGRGKGTSPMPLILICLSLLVLILNFLACFAPPADLSDALAYQLNVPKQWVQAGKIIDLPLDVNGAFPMLINAGFGVGLMFGSLSFANLLGLWISVLCALGVYGWALEKVSPTYALLGATAFLLTPAVYNHLNIPYVDIALALYVLIACWAFYKWSSGWRDPHNGSCPGQPAGFPRRMMPRLRGPIGRPPRSPVVYIYLSGLACGFALSIKYLAMIYAGIIGIAILIEGIRKRCSPWLIVRWLVLFGAAVLIVAGIWYWRNYQAMGNPVYPFMAKFFGGRPTSVSWQLAERTYGMGYDLLHLLRLFWDATFHPQAYAGFGTRWNLLFLGLLPLVLLFAAKNKGGGWLMGLSAAILLSWFFISQIMRFLMVFFPLYCVLMAWAAFQIQDWRPALRRMIWTWIMLVLLWETACVAAHAMAPIKASLGPSARESYLLGKEPTYAMAKWVNENLPEDSKILSDSEVRLFYFKPLTLREPTLRLFTRYPEKHATPQETVAAFKEQGFTHVLISERAGDGTDDSDLADHPHRLRRLVRDASMFKLLQELSFDSADEKQRYSLYVIP